MICKTFKYIPELIYVQSWKIREMKPVGKIDKNIFYHFEPVLKNIKFKISKSLIDSYSMNYHSNNFTTINISTYQIDYEQYVVNSCIYIPVKIIDEYIRKQKLKNILNIN